jgi:hypothetical protein
MEVVEGDVPDGFSCQYRWTTEVTIVILSFKVLKRTLGQCTEIC